MTEQQSRYGIMEELNKRKINQKEKLANIERDTDSKTFEDDKNILNLKEEITAKEKSYKVEFMQRKQQSKVNLDMITNDYNRAKEQLEERMVDDEGNYEKRFQEWKKLKKESIVLTEAELKRYKEVQGKKITEKKEIITEIDNGIASLKEMSAEQKGE